ncbi:MAG: PaaX family transcriptional regulator [Haloechinothrix sp.]
MTLLGAYIHPRESRAVWSGGLVALLAELGFSQGAARIALTRLANRGLLARSKHGRQVHYLITPRGLAMLADGDRRIFSLGRSESDAEQWTMLWHTIPDDRRKAREVLVRRLRFLGFGSIQDGMWLAPRDRHREVSELLADLDVRSHAGLMLGRPAASVDARAFVARAWDLDALEVRYAAFVADFGRYGSPGVRAALDGAALFALRTRLVHAFRQFPFLDPELPDEPGSLPARRAAAVTLFDDLYRAWAPDAQRHFDEVTAP